MIIMSYITTTNKLDDLDPWTLARSWPESWSKSRGTLLEQKDRTSQLWLHWNFNLESKHLLLLESWIFLKYLHCQPSHVSISLDFAPHTFIAMISARVMMMKSWIWANLFPSSLIMKDPTSQVNNKRRHRGATRILPCQGSWRTSRRHWKKSLRNMVPRSRCLKGKWATKKSLVHWFVEDYTLKVGLL